jgi:fluoroacetyl-CoA thioesterase
MSPPLVVGLRKELTVAVNDRLIVPAMSADYTAFADMPPVFATAFLVGFVEWACIDLLRPFLEPSQRTVGIHVDLSHIAATPVGMRVTAAVELIGIEGRRLRFKAECRDEVELVGEGVHDRFIIEHDKFLARTLRKRAGGDGTGTRQSR